MNGVCPIVEPGLEKLLREVLAQKNFRVSNELEPADCFIIAVPTPFTRDKQADLSYVWRAAKTIAKKIQPGNLVILESTVPVGTTQKLAKFFPHAYVAYCPERVLPGKIVHELIHNDRIIGGICERSAQLAQEFYKKLVRGTCYVTSDKVAEMVKLVENSSRDIQIAFANQIAGMCDREKIDPFEVIRLANRHPRVEILQPGCGVGGHCIAVDPWFLIKRFPNNSQLLQAARTINDTKPSVVIKKVFEKVAKFFITHKRKPNVLVLGITFKPDVDDQRESPALSITNHLFFQGKILNLSICDPFVPEYNINISSALSQADIIIALVKHSCFKTIDKKFIVNKIIVDPCGLFSTQLGSNYEATFLRKRERNPVIRSNATG